MKLLAIETATERGMFAILENDTVLHEKHLPYGLQEAQKLLGLLEQTSGALDGLDAIAVGVGPGSYTGMRIAATIGKMLSYALKVPLVGVCSMHVFAPKQDGPFAVAFDAKISGAYLQEGMKTPNGVIFTTGPQVLPLEQAVEFLQRFPVVVSPHVEMLRGKCPGYNGTWEEAAPSAMLMWEVSKHAKEGDLSLLYMRKTQAEIEKGQ